MEAIGEDSSWLDQDAPSGDEQYAEDDEERMVVNPVSVRQRIDSALEILSDFSNRPDKSVSRSDTLANLAKDLSEYYGYIPDLSELLLDIFSPAECVEYMDASDRPRPLVIRANTLKVTRKDLMESLGKRGVNLEGVEWSKVAIKVTESTVPIGATPEYLAGYYMLQAAASLNPVMALAPQPGERVLDMSSAPGGKTSYIAQLMKNSGTVVANDLKPQRQKATVANLHRMGVKNAIVCCYDGRKIPKIMKGFDRVLLDAPCSGLGIISRDQSVKLQRSVKDIKRLAHLQKELLCAAVDATDPNSKTGGVIVYSTCSISNEENEQVVQYILQKRHVRLVETGLEVGRPGFTRYKERRFHPSLALTRRFYPHVHNMDGFYVAKFVKYANGPKGAEDSDEEDAVEDSEDEDESPVSDEEESSDAEEVPPQPPVKKGRKVSAPATQPGEKKAENSGNAASSDIKKKSSSSAVPAVNGSSKAEKTYPTKAPVAAVTVTSEKKLTTPKAANQTKESVSDHTAETGSAGGKSLKRKALSVCEPTAAAGVESASSTEALVKSAKVKKSRSQKEPEPAIVAHAEEEAMMNSLHRSMRSGVTTKRKSLRAIREESMAAKKK